MTTTLVRTGLILAWSCISVLAQSTLEGVKVDVEVHGAGGRRQLLITNLKNLPVTAWVVATVRSNSAGPRFRTESTFIFDSLLDRKVGAVQPSETRAVPLPPHTDRISDRVTERIDVVAALLSDGTLLGNPEIGALLRERRIATADTLREIELILRSGQQLSLPASELSSRLKTLMPSGSAGGPDHAIQAQKQAVLSGIIGALSQISANPRSEADMLDRLTNDVGISARALSMALATAKAK